MECHTRLTGAIRPTLARKPEQFCIWRMGRALHLGSIRASLINQLA